MPHLEQAIESLDVRLTDDDISALEAPYVPHPILGHS
jgi:aryl-alcohol dehydrogenase-like predicted oxidoreductase